MTDYADNQHPGNSILIWDSEGVFPTDDGTTLLWRSYDCDGSADVISIPQLVEDNAYRLRSRYLAWIYELGETRIRSKRLVDHLEVHPGFSYWWMTLIAEKCNFAKSPQITDAIRLMAFENWVYGKSVTRVVFKTHNAQLAESVRLLCISLGTAFEWQRIEGDAIIEQRKFMTRLYLTLPNSVQAFVWLLRYLIDRWPLKSVGLREWQKTKGDVCFISYLFNLVPEAAKEGVFESRYWAHLPKDLQRDGCKTNWLHLYVKDAVLPNSRDAAAVVRNFNKREQGKQVHVTLDSFLSIEVVFRTLRDMFRLALVAPKLSKVLSSYSSSSMYLWSIFTEEWLESIYGVTAMSNLLFLNLFESALNSLPEQREGVYLQENQGWEFALIYAWKAAGHGQLIGAPHSTVRFWDLRYFFDTRSYSRLSNNELPMPTQVACNGGAANSAYKDGGYPQDNLVDVEALRYLHLCHAKVKTSTTPLSKNNVIHLLVLGDYLISNTQLQMKLLVQAVPFLPAGCVVTVKPHPNCPIHQEDYPSLNMRVTMEPIAKLLAECDVAYSSAVTSAAVDAYCAGVPIVSVLDPGTLNLSPLRGCDGALFASTSEELADALITASAFRYDTVAKGKNYFTLDSKLPRWRNLLRGSIL